ncbi:MAG: hypothetical protein WBD47_03595 [Phormidesmis sp.]
MIANETSCNSHNPAIGSKKVFGMGFTIKNIVRRLKKRSPVKKPFTSLSAQLRDEQFSVPQSLIDDGLEADEPADLALSDLIPPELALLNLPGALSHARPKARTVSTYAASTSAFSISDLIGLDEVDLPDFIPSGLSALDLDLD